jgi:hypothetical protein
MASEPILKETPVANSPEMTESDSKSNDQQSPAVKAKNLGEADAEEAASVRSRTDNARKPSAIPIPASKPAKHQEESTGNDMPVHLQALGEAETARLKGNHAYSNGRLGDAIAIYSMAERLLTAARETEEG